ncbi:MAG: PASTA domain-containing protein, partial [Oscillospiraceae bacterium]|nr:PASTA domain-containing protein [Oscillospiraceae bacterium]
GSKYSDILGDPEYAQYYNFLEPEYKSSDSYAEGYVVEQEPTAERQQTLKAGGIDVRLTVSTGPPPVPTMPNVVNMDYRLAISELEGLNLDLAISREPVVSDSVTPDYVIETVPAAGEPLARGKMVFIKYSMGPETIYVSVPSVEGLKLDVGQSRLESYDLTVSIEYVYDAAEAETIIFQNIKGGQVPLRTEIVIQVSKGPEPTPTPPETPTDTPTPPPLETYPEQLPVYSPPPTDGGDGGDGGMTGIPPDISGDGENTSPFDAFPP